jgi:hypothetical protein
LLNIWERMEYILPYRHILIFGSCVITVYTYRYVLESRGCAAEDPYRPDQGAIIIAAPARYYEMTWIHYRSCLSAPWVGPAVSLWSLSTLCQSHPMWGWSFQVCSVVSVLPPSSLAILDHLSSPKAAKLLSISTTAQKERPFPEVSFFSLQHTGRRERIERGTCSAFLVCWFRCEQPVSFF